MYTLANLYLNNIAIKKIYEKIDEYFTKEYLRTHVFLQVCKYDHISWSTLKFYECKTVLSFDNTKFVF